MINKFFFCSLLIGVSIILPSGCAYKLGSHVDIPQRFNIEVFNDTLIPQLEQAVTSQIKKDFIRAGVDLEAKESDFANSASLTVRIFDSSDKGEIFAKDDTLLAQAFQYRIFAELTYEDHAGRVVGKETVSAESIASRPTDRSSPTRRSAITALAKNLSAEVMFSLQQVAW